MSWILINYKGKGCGFLNGKVEKQIDKDKDEQFVAFCIQYHY